MRRSSFYEAIECGVGPNGVVIAKKTGVLEVVYRGNDVVNVGKIGFNPTAVDEERKEDAFAGNGASDDGAAFWILGFASYSTEDALRGIREVWAALARDPGAQGCDAAHDGDHRGQDCDDLKHGTAFRWSFAQWGGDCAKYIPVVTAGAIRARMSGGGLAWVTIDVEWESGAHTQHFAADRGRFAVAIGPDLKGSTK